MSDSPQAKAYATLMSKVKAQITPAHLKELSAHYTDLLDVPTEFDNTNALVSFLCTDRGLARDNLTPLMDALTLCTDVRETAFVLVQDYLKVCGLEARKAMANKVVMDMMRTEPPAFLKEPARPGPMDKEDAAYLAAALGPHTKCMPRDMTSPAPWINTPADRATFQSIIDRNNMDHGIPGSASSVPRQRLVVEPQDRRARIETHTMREDQNVTFPWSIHQPNSDTPTDHLPEPTDAEYAKLMAGLVPHFSDTQRTDLATYYSALCGAPHYWTTATAFFAFLGERGLTKTHVAPLAQAMDHGKTWPAARRLLTTYAGKHGLSLNY